MKFSVIYEQVVKEQTEFIIEAESESVLLATLEEAEEYARGLKDTIDDLRFSLNEQEDINVLVINEDYYSSWKAPGYYDHNEVK